MSSRSFKIAFTLGLIASAGVGISACSSDDEAKPSGTAGTGAGATGGASGSSGTGAGGTSGTGAGGTSGTGAGGTGGSGGNQPITCGTKTCQPGGLGFIPACCIDNSRCGIDPPELTIDGGDLPCTEVDQPGNPDPSCFADAGIDFTDSGLDAAQFDASDLLDGGRYTVPGCCRPNGMCGIIVSVPQIGLSLGCVDPSEYGSLFDAGPPQSCTPRNA